MNHTTMTWYHLQASEQRSVVKRHASFSRASSSSVSPDCGEAGRVSSYFTPTNDRGLHTNREEENPIHLPASAKSHKDLCSQSFHGQALATLTTGASPSGHFRNSSE